MNAITPDFMLAQLRLAAVAIIAYLSGRGIFTPADATLATALLTAIGPILAPWLLSIYSNLGTVKVSNGSKAAVVAAVEKTTDSKAAAINAIDNMQEPAK